MKRTLPVILGIAGLASVAATPAAAQLTGNAAVTSNYIFRGLSQSAADPAVQAGVDYGFGDTIPGVSVGTWFSSINFGDGSPLEWDVYGGYSGNFTDKLSYSVNMIGYIYPNVPHGVSYDWFEIWGSLAYDFGMFSVSGKLYYSPDYVNLDVSELYYTGGVSVPLADWLSVSANIGHTTLEDPVYPLIKDYTDWNISIAATWTNYTVTVGYTDTSGLDGAYKVTSGPFQTTGQVFVMFGMKVP